jgi:hypothetical protein
MQAIDRSIKANRKAQGSLSTLTDVAMAMDRKPTGYPILTTYPLSERLIRYYTGGICDVERIVRFEVQAVKPTAQTSFGMSTGLINNVRLHFSRMRNSDTWQLKNEAGQDIVFNTQVSEIKTHDPIAEVNAIYTASHIDVSFICQIRIDDLAPLGSSGLTNTNMKELIKILSEILEGYKTTTLSEIKTIKYGQVEPIKAFPAIAILSETADIKKKFSGVDVYDTNIAILAYSELFKLPESVYQNLDIIDKVRKIVFANKYILNRVYNYTINPIVHGIAEVGGKFVMSSQLAINTQSFEKVN